MPTLTIDAESDDMMPTAAVRTAAMSCGELLIREAEQSLGRGVPVGKAWLMHNVQRMALANFGAAILDHLGKQGSRSVAAGVLAAAVADHAAELRQQAAADAARGATVDESSARFEDKTGRMTGMRIIKRPARPGEVPVR